MSPSLATAPWRSVVSIVAWGLAGLVVAVAASQVLGLNGHRIVAGAQAFSPYLLAVSFPLAAAALVSGRRALAVTALLGAVVLVVVAWPLLRPPAEAAPAPGATPVRVFHANLLYENDDVDAIVETLDRVDADVLAFTEYTPVHAAAFAASDLAERFPYRIEDPHSRAYGTAVWSRFPITELPGADLRDDPIFVTVDAPEPFRLYVTHPVSPLVDAGRLRDELARIADSGLADGPPTLMVGDFNSGFWHPAFRDLLGAGWRDADIVTGQGFSTSWPAGRPVPPFVRLDHALVNDGLVVTGIENVRVPGSDHVGFVVTVAAA